MFQARVRTFKPARAAVLLLAFAAAAAGAQQVYRIVGPDGKVTFSDKPPVEPGAKAAPAPVVPLPSAGGSTNAPARSAIANAQPAAGPGLPFELRQAAQRFPVTLYTGPNCGPCGNGRSYLMQRGVPFSERTVNTAEDVGALERLTGGSPSLPLLTIGNQQIRGFSDAEWAQFLDAAGYPKTSQLPAGYRAPAPAPLVTTAPVQPATPAPAPAAAEAAVPAAPTLPPPARNPAGITF